MLRSADRGHTRHGTEEEVDADPVPGLQARRQGFRSDASRMHWSLLFIGQGVVNVIRHLAVNTHRLNPPDHAFSRALQHLVSPDLLDPRSLPLDRANARHLDPGHGCLSLERGGFNLLDDIEPRCHPPEDRVLAIQRRRRSQDDEE